MNHLCYFEISYILKTVMYPSIFNTTLNISRIVDVEPLIEFKKKMLEAQKSLTTTLLPLEMSIKKRLNDEEYKTFMQAEKDKKQAEKAKKEEEANAGKPAVEGDADKKEEPKADEDEPDKEKEEAADAFRKK